MNMENLSTYDQMLLEDAAGLRQEELILEVTEALARALENSGLTKTELAGRLGKTKGFVSQVLGGGSNLTLRTLADLSGALDCRVHVQLEPMRVSSASARRWNHRPVQAEAARPFSAPPLLNFQLAA
jgi:transcriptional regulator with XRE-family HTH domain